MNDDDKTNKPPMIVAYLVMSPPTVGVYIVPSPEQPNELLYYPTTPYYAPAEILRLNQRIDALLEMVKELAKDVGKLHRRRVRRARRKS